MEYERTLLLMRICVNSVYSLGMSPLKFDTETGTVIHVDSHSRYSIYAPMLSIATITRILLLTWLAKDFPAGNILVTDRFDILQLGVTLAGVYVFGNHLHNFWKRDEIPQTINSFLQHYATFNERTGMLSKPGQRIQHYLYNLFIITTYLNLWTIPAATTFYYIRHCRGHFLSGLLPICERISPGVWRHVIDWSTPGYFIGICSLQFLLATEYISGVFVNVGAIYFLTFGSQQISKEMADWKLSRTEWLANYRALKVLEAQINSCIGGLWMPLNLFGLMLITVAGTTIVIRVHPGITMSLIWAMLASVSVLAQFVITYFASNGVAFSKKAIQLRKSESRTGSERRALQNCRPLGIKSGSFRIVDRSAMLILMCANVDYTISVLLAMKERNE